MCATARSRIDDQETPQSLPRGARMTLKDYSDKEAVQSREQGLVYTQSSIMNRKFLKKNQQLKIRTILG